VTDPLGGNTIYQYNGNADLILLTDANGHTTAYSYDVLRRLSMVTDPLGRQKRYNYDAVGDVTSIVDGNSKTDTFGYDALNRLAGMWLSDGKTVAYTYDAVGNRLTMVDWRGTTSYAYDPLNRVTSVSMPGANTIGYTYDAAGNRSTLTYPDGRLVQFSFDPLNRLSKVTDWASKVTSYTYDAAGNLTGFAHPNGAASSYQYDAANRLTNIANHSGSSTLSSFAYTLDKVGNRLQMSTSAGGLNQFGYDSLYRLTSWTAPSAQITQWTYDATGNRKTMVSPAGTTSYVYDPADELLSAGTTAYGYDGNGNQLSKSTGSSAVNYGWDALNRLISVTGGGVNTQYQYDGDGNRVSQQIPAGTYAYVNDPAAGLPVVLNENGPDGNIDYLYGLSLISATASAFQYYHQFDGIGSTINLTDSTGALKANYSYDPWGKLTLPIDPAPKDKFKFTAEAVDGNAGLLFLRARYYDSTLGRFFSPDPLQSQQVKASYVYAGNTPTRNVDPSGLSFDAFLQNYSRAFSDAVGTIPSFAACSASGFQATNACTRIGFNQAQIAAGQALSPIGFVTGPVAVAYHVTPQIINGTLSNADAAKTVWDLATSFPYSGGLKYLPDLQYALMPTVESSNSDFWSIRGPQK
jgi:RHS repeat-associated protein